MCQIEDYRRNKFMENSMKLYENCKLCPRECGVNRSVQKGVCKSSDNCKIVRAALHFWEEPCISGTEGSGTIFFEGCSLGCVFCQNYEISDGNSEYGVEVTVERLVEIFFELKEKGANNINFVTPTHFMPHIKEAIVIAKEKGFDLPFVYNTSGYEKVECLRELDGLIDVYLPDMKYGEDMKDIAFEYSNAKDYFQVNRGTVSSRKSGEKMNNVYDLINFNLEENNYPKNTVKLYVVYPYSSTLLKVLMNVNINLLNLILIYMEQK
jgi:putative pyruvate formate lyase activating enzyme